MRIGQDAMVPQFANDQMDADLKGAVDRRRFITAATVAVCDTGREDTVKLKGLAKPLDRAK